MAKITGISWAHSTFNPWLGCQKISAACQNCYAESVAKRMGKKLWGKDAARMFTSEDYWNQPIKWNEEAARGQSPWRVFCGSLCDVMEDRRDLDARREMLWDLITDTPYLTWLLLTKRPENFCKFTPEEWKDGWPANVWAMTTAENQRRLEERLPHLIKVPAVVRGLSIEPLLGPIDLSRWLPAGRANWQCQKCWAYVGGGRNASCPWCKAGPGWMCGSHSANRRDPSNKFEGWTNRQVIDWCIVGGESGGHSRPMHPEWAIRLRDQCVAGNVAFHFKQWGNWAPYKGTPVALEKLAFFNKHENGDQPILIKDLSPERREDWAEGEPDDVFMERMAIKKAGRLLDGKLWDQTPTAMVVPLEG